MTPARRTNCIIEANDSLSQKKWFPVANNNRRLASRHSAAAELRGNAEFTDEFAGASGRKQEDGVIDGI
jgi:hypothetical protein